jgi:hypothetical protein
MPTNRLLLRTLDELRITDERAFRSIPQYAALKATLQRARYRFRCLAGEQAGRWDRALLLNLAFWGGEGDVLVGPELPADVVTHVAWHHVARGEVGSLSADALFFGEAIASAFDVYLIGQLLARGERSTFLESQTTAMAEAAQGAGLSARGFAALLQHCAEDPQRAFEELRALLFDASTRLLAARSSRRAVDVLTKLDAHPFAPLLHHFELATWILYARAYVPEELAPVPSIRALDRELRRATRPLDVLVDRWLS